MLQTKCMPMPKPKFILASTSKYRAQILKDFGLEFVQMSPKVNEDDLKIKYKNLTPLELCKSLAQEKAKSLATEYPDCIVIGSDQLGEFNGRILGKPGSIEKNVEQLLLLNGKTHDLITSLCVCYKNRIEIATVVARLTLRQLSEKQIRAYVSHDMAIDCAGGYKIEQQGIALMQSIETNDFTSIKGLPLLAFNDCLIKLGVNLLENNS